MENLLIYCIGISILILLIVIIIQSNQNTSKTINLTRFEKKVTQLLDEEGITWKKEDGEMYIVKQGVRFDTYFRTIEGRPSARVFFVYRTADEGLKPISGWGQLVMADQLNSNNVGITTIIRNEGVHSVYYADVRNANECWLEFNHAFDRFQGLMHEYKQLKPKILKDFPEKQQKNSIGFG